MSIGERTAEQQNSRKAVFSSQTNYAVHAMCASQKEENPWKGSLESE